MERYRYRISGVGLACEIPLDGLEISKRPLPRSWRLVASRGGFPFPTPRPRRRFRSQRRLDGSWVLAWPHRGAFWIRPEERCVDYIPVPEASRDAFLDVLLGPVVSYLLLLDGRDPLHASAVRVGEQAMCFLGQPGAGKSTMAAAFLLAGYGIVADDVLTIEWEGGCPRAVPGYPEIRLWPGSGRRLLPSFANLPKVLSTSSKRRLDPREYDGEFVRAPVPIRSIYELRRTRGRSPTVHPLDGREAFLAVARNLYNDAALGPDVLGRRFRLIGELARRVPVRRLRIPQGWADSRSLLNVVLEDLEGVRQDGEDQR